MKRLVPFVLPALTLLALSGQAHARDVYLNGVKLDSNVVLKNQTFSACEVKFDENGNVFITAKGIKVQLQAEGGGAADTAKDQPPPADGKLTKQYWLVSKQSKRGIVQYDIDVFVNDTFVKKVRSSDDPTFLEVTKYVKAGGNKVRVVAVKNAGDKRASQSPTDVMEVILGEGTLAGGTITIAKPVVTYQRTAAETGNFSDDYSFTGR